MICDQYHDEVGMLITRSSWWFSFQGFFLTYFLQCWGVGGYIDIISNHIHTCTCTVITRIIYYFYCSREAVTGPSKRALYRAIKGAISVAGSAALWARGPTV